MNLVLTFTTLSIDKSILLLIFTAKSIVLHTESDLAWCYFAWFAGFFFLLSSQSFLCYSLSTGLIHTYIRLFHVPLGLFSEIYNKTKLVLCY